MNEVKYVFSQIMAFIDHNEFNRCVDRYGGTRRVRHFSCWKQFLCMAFGQTTHRQVLLGIRSECRQDPNLDRHIHLRHSGHCQKETQSEALDVRDSTDFEH